jgi:hydroxymethylpyrimidine/phosphomethylpyrimidine kinase
MTVPKLLCPIEGCNLEMKNVTPPTEEAASTSAKGIVRKPMAVARVYDGTCPEHGRVTVVLRGHHIDTENAVVFVADDEWQQVAFEASQIDRKPTS